MTTVPAPVAALTKRPSTWLAAATRESAELDAWLTLRRIAGDSLPKENRR